MRYLIFTSFIFHLIGCSINTDTYDISDSSKKQTIILKKKSGEGNVHAINITGEGDINGEATIALILNGEPYKTEKLSGRINFQWGGDWYADTAEIIYEPQKVTKGKISLNYKFETL